MVFSDDFNAEDLVKKIEKATIAVGTEIMCMRSSFTKDYKGKHKEIVTSADIRANELLIESLARLVPNSYWFSEESEDRYAIRSRHKNIWIVDPLDGTKYFVNAEEGFAVSVALVVDREPIIGAIYDPIRKIAYTAVQGGGAYANGVKMQVSSTKNIEEAVMLASPNKVDKLKNMTDKIPHKQERACRGMAIRAVNVASGNGDFFVGLGTSEWSIAAGDLILCEAGGAITNDYNVRFTYNNKTPYYKPVIASNGKIHQQILGCIQ
jgi:myo-inositol-1(or 4)-monophosphatase